MVRLVHIEKGRYIRVTADEYSQNLSYYSHYKIAEEYEEVDDSGKEIGRKTKEEKIKLSSSEQGAKKKTRSSRSKNRRGTN